MSYVYMPEAASLGDIFRSVRPSYFWRRGFDGKLRDAKPHQTHGEIFTTLDDRSGLMTSDGGLGLHFYAAPTQAFTDKIGAFEHGGSFDINLWPDGAAAIYANFRWDTGGGSNSYLVTKLDAKSVAEQLSKLMAASLFPAFNNQNGER